MTIAAHLIKYPHGNSGLLLGPSKPSPEVTLALPVSHSGLTLHTSTTFEIAVHLAEAYAVAHDISIMGIYYGNEAIQDESVGNVPSRLADAAHSKYEEALLLMVDTKMLTPANRLSGHAFKVYRKSGSRSWARRRLEADALRVTARGLQGADKLMKGDLYALDVIDFEDHCADPKSDWFNEKVREEWDQIATMG